MSTIVPINLATIAATDNIRCLDEGAIMRFLLKGESSTIVTEFDGTNAILFPERDIGHLKLRAALGL
jgi:hypothetical protein